MKVLIIVDMQHDFVDGALGSPEARAIVPVMQERLRNEYADGNTLVIFTKDTHDENYMHTQEGKNLPVPHCIDKTPGWCILKEIASIVDGGHFLKMECSDMPNSRITKDTFGSVRLAHFLAENYEEEHITFDEIVLMGVCTDICVVSNALLLKAYMPEVKITVDASCCAGVTPESHKAALATMKSCQINVINE